MPDLAVHVEGVVKRFKTTTALAGVDLDVEEATVFGLLGPNGAGKTTLVRVLATLLTPDAGRAEVFGRDVVHDAAGVRELLALTGQFAAVDEMLTGRENLQMFGRLFDLSAADACRQSSELLDKMPEFVFRAAGPVHVLRDLGHLAFIHGPPEQPPAVTGYDVALVRDGRIAVLYTLVNTGG